MKPSEFEERVEALFGGRIARVRYHEIDYLGLDGEPLAVPAWNGSPDFDSLDYGFELTMDDGRTYHVTWGAEFAQYGVTAQAKPLHDVSANRVWDVSAASRWALLLGKQIVAADVFWSWFELADGSQRTEYPQDIRLTFEDDSVVYVSAYEVREGGFRMGMMDHITVFFDEGAAESHQIGPFASDHRAV
ncbi:hypothetical protein [Rubrivirga sp.]|uniref:hypothetical protein n=1 Tax=Rubrivirga sp. TaxID=1885344 RepID=UPI003C766EC7